MYIASRAAAASTASEIIVNIIIVTLSLIFKLLILKTFFFTSLGLIFFFFRGQRYAVFRYVVSLYEHFHTKIAFSLTSINNIWVSLICIKEIFCIFADEYENE